MNNTTSWNDTQKLLAFIIVAALVLVIFVWMFFPPKGDQAAIAVLTTLVGALVANAGNVVSFYFGSSRDGRNKDSTIAALAAPTSTNGNGHPADPAKPPTAAG